MARCCMAITWWWIETATISSSKSPDASGQGNRWLAERPAGSPFQLLGDVGIDDGKQASLKQVTPVREGGNADLGEASVLLGRGNHRQTGRYFAVSRDPN